MAQPLPFPAALVNENCPECKGTGTRVARAPDHPCDYCEGTGRSLREVPLDEFWEMAQRAHAERIAPPPSRLAGDVPIPGERLRS